MRRIPAWVPWTIAALSVVALAAAAVAGATVDPHLGMQRVGFADSGWWLAYLTLTFVGAVVATQRPDNPVGWLMIAGGAVNAITQAAAQYAVWGLARHPGSLPGAAGAAWLGALLWEPAIALVIVMAAYFPTGQLASPRWRWVPAVVGLGSAVIVVVSAIGLWSLRGPRLVSAKNDSISHSSVAAVVGVAYPIVLIGAVGALLSVVVRYRRAHGIERQQLKWLMWAAVLTAPGIVVGQFIANSESGAGAVIQLLNSPLWFAIAAALAILRYRLYDIDRIVSRTVSYVAVTALVVGVYIGLVALTGTVLDLSNGVAVAASTLAAAAAFQPLRRRVQGAVDRRFDRAAYDSRRTAEEFSQRLRDEVDVDTIRDDLLLTVADVVSPTSVTLWVAHA